MSAAEHGGAETPQRVVSYRVTKQCMTQGSSLQNFTVPNVSFSPHSCGRVNPRSVIDEIITQGTIKFTV